MSESGQPILGAEIVEKLETDWALEISGRMDALRTAVKAFLDAGDEVSARLVESERIAFAFRPTRDRTRGRWYGPIFEGVDDKGHKVEWPTRNHLDGSGLQHLRARALSSNNPHTQARFCDLIWEFEERPDPDFARKAIAAYLTIVGHHLKQNVQDEALTIARHLRRAGIIANQLKERRLKAEVMTAHREVFDAILRGMNLPIVPCADVLRSMMEDGDGLTDREVNDRLAELETWANQHQQDVSTLLREEILNVRIEWAQRQKSHATAHQRRLEIAQLRESEGDDALGRSALVAQTFFLKAHQMYADLGAVADAARVKKKLEQVGPKTLSEMKRFSTEVTIPRDQIEQIANVLRQFSAGDALRLMTGYRWWIPKAEAARRWLEHGKKTYPIQFLIPKVIQDQDGNAYQLAQGQERDRHEVFHYIATELMMSARLSMREAFKVLVEELRVTTDDFLEILREASWLDSGRLEILREAFDNYLAGRQVSAAHILIPQFEGALRDLADSAGLTPIAVRGRRMVPQTMDVLLGDQRLRDGLGDDFTSTLQAFLTDEVGMRVRHVISHGNVSKAGYFAPGLTEILIYLILQLSSFRLSVADSQGGFDTRRE